jgi:hypothetical protein
VLESLEDFGWNDVVPQGATNSNEDSDPAFNDSLLKNQLSINLKLMRMNFETLERRLTKGLVSYEEALKSLGSQVHETRVQVVKYSGIYTSGEESVWEGIAGVHVKMDSMESMLRSEILSEIMPIIGCIKSNAAAGTSALVNWEVSLATRQLSSELQPARHEHHVAISSLESDFNRLVGLVGLLSRSHICGALSSDFPTDWELVLDFLGRHTSPGSGRVGDKIEDCVARFDVVPSLPGGLWPQRSLTEKPGTIPTSDQVINMKKDIADLRDRISSNSVSIDSFIFLSLGKTPAWCIQHLPGDVDQALVCIGAPSLLHGIGREFLSNQDTREWLYQNKKAGISSFALTLHSSFSTVLPEILVKSITVSVEDNGLLLPYAKTYKDWFCNENGVNTGVKTQILSELEHQRAIHDEVLTNLAVTHPVGAQLGRLLLQRSCAFVEFMVRL